MPIAPRPLKEVFLEALAVAPAERDVWLVRECGEDAHLRRQVELMLVAHDTPQSLLDRVAPPGERSGAATETFTPADFERAGTVIGPYKLLEPIGEGGFGVVFMAEQQHPVRRKVAIKVLKPGMDTRQVVARFEAERQALALMDHPNIAKVFDAGATDSGRPYFVMELVRGVPVTDFCDHNRLGVRDRLGLFADVCRAVQHAHQKGVIHRDLKPGNVLVTLHDGKPVPKVIDFGVAKAVGQPLTDKTLFTGFTQMLGTPLYMSPEQAELSGLDVDTRADVYSLGVLLYELLTGTTPFDRDRLRTLGLDEVRRIIREEEPARPSTRVSTLGQAAITASANRGTDPRALSQLFRGELDWVVMKALEKDRNRRYETAAALAADVQRYLADEPVQACPPSAAYRLRKLVRRNKGVFITASMAAAAAVLAVAGLAGAVMVLKDEKRQTDEALKGERQAKEDLERTSYYRSIALTSRELSAGNVGRAEELLDGCPPDLRGWEWQFLKRQRYGNLFPFRHPDTVLRVAFSPDGRQIASGCLDGTVRVWNAQTPGEPLTLPAQAPLVRALAYSPDGLHLAVAYQDGVICAWKAATGELLATLRGHEQTVWQVAFSPDGRTLASAGQDRSVRLWDLGPTPGSGTNRLIRVLGEHPADVKGVAFSPDGGRLAAACRDGTVKTWDVDGGRELSAYRHPLQSVDNACFSPDGRRLAWSCMDGLIRVWETATGGEAFAVQSNTHYGRSVAFSPDGRRIAVAGFDGTLRLLDGSTGREALTIHAHTSLVSGVAFSPDGHRLASASYDHTVRVWDATPLTGDPLSPHCVTLTGHAQQVYGVAFSRDGRWLASASLDRTVKVWELLGRGEPGPPTPGGIALRHTLRGHSADVVDVAFSPDGNILASAGWDNVVKLWELDPPAGEAPAERRTIPCAERIFSVSFSPDGRLLAVGLLNGIALYDPATGHEAHPLKRSPTPVPALAFSPDGRRLVSAAATDPAVKVWDVAGLSPTFEIRHGSNPNSTVAVSPDGRHIASPGRDRTVKIWTVRDWAGVADAEPRTLSGHLGYVWKVAFSPDGRYLASGSWDSSIKVWDLEAPATAEPVTLRGHAGFIRSLAFSPDGRRLASAGGYAAHGEVKVWDATLWESKVSR